MGRNLLSTCNTVTTMQQHTTIEAPPSRGSTRVTMKERARERERARRGGRKKGLSRNETTKKKERARGRVICQIRQPHGETEKAELYGRRRRRQSPVPQLTTAKRKRETDIITRGYGTVKVSAVVFLLVLQHAHPVATEDTKRVLMCVSCTEKFACTHLSVHTIYRRLRALCSSLLSKTPTIGGKNGHENNSYALVRTSHQQGESMDSTGFNASPDEEHAKHTGEGKRKAKLRLRSRELETKMSRVDSAEVTRDESEDGEKCARVERKNSSQAYTPATKHRQETRKRNACAPRPAHISQSTVQWREHTNVQARLLAKQQFFAWEKKGGLTRSLLIRFVDVSGTFFSLGSLLSRTASIVHHEPSPRTCVCECVISSQCSFFSFSAFSFRFFSLFRFSFAGEVIYTLHLLVCRFRRFLHCSWKHVSRRDVGRRWSRRKAPYTRTNIENSAERLAHTQAKKRKSK